MGMSNNRTPRRYIAAERPCILYLQYRSVEQDSGRTPGSYRTFLKAYNITFYRVGFLGFRKAKGDHAKCTACEGP